MGSPAVQSILLDARNDAVKRARAIGKEKFVSDSVQHLGFYHGGGWRAARKFLVVPGNHRFRESATEVILQSEL